MTTATKKTTKMPASLNDITHKPLRLNGDTILDAEDVQILYESITDLDDWFTRADLGTNIDQIAMRTLSDEGLNRLADNLLRRWKRQGLVEFQGGKFDNALWRTTF